MVEEKSLVSPTGMAVGVREVELDVMRAFEDASVLREGKLVFAIGHENWSMGERYQTLTAATTVDANMLWHAADDHYRLEYIVELSSALLASASELLKLYGRFLDPVFTKLSKGFTSLPDELLGLIFRFAAHPEEEGTEYIERLARVSHRFRRIILGDSTLWTTLSMNQDTTTEYVKRCIARSGPNNDLHIIIDSNKSVSSATITGFIGTCVSVASRWTTLTLSADWIRGWDTPESGYGFKLGECFVRILRHNLTFPRLQELYLAQRFPGNHGSKSIWVVSTNNAANNQWIWTAPNLRVLRCTQYIPNGFSPLISITSFSLHLTLDFDETSRQLSELHSFLSSLANVSDVELEIINLDDDKDMMFLGVHRLSEVTLPSVTTFRLRIEDYTGTFESAEFMESFIYRLRMPLIENSSLCLEWDPQSAYSSPNETSEKLSELVDAFTPRYCDSLKSFSVELSLPDANDDTDYESDESANSAILEISISSISPASSLSITTYGKITFSYMPEFGDMWISSSSLREIRLRDCDNMDVEALREMVQSLKKRDAWDPLECVIIQGCDLLESNAESVMDIDREKISFAA